MNTWKYYNHAAIPTTPPNVDPDLSPIENNDIWKIPGFPLLARWTTDFDCGYETNWWYVIKDDEFDLSALKSNYRYKINKGIKNFDVRVINPQEYVHDLYKVFTAAYDSWPAKYRPNVTSNDIETLVKNLSLDPETVCFGAFYRETSELCGFMQAPTHEMYAELLVQRVNPAYEKLQINAALVYGLLENNRESLQRGNFYIIDGARSINHETTFQDYLEKYFGFRKAYCQLHITYNPKIKWIFKLLYPLRKLFLKFDNIGLVHKLNSIFQMEEISRNQVNKT